MNIFNEIDYRKIIFITTNQKKKLHSDFNFQHLAETIRVQKTYLSNCLKGKANLSFDQMYLACKALNFNEEESLYMHVLLDYERTGLKNRKIELLNQIKNIQNRNLHTENHINSKKLSTDIKDLAEYYLDPVNQIIHVCLAITKYKNDIKLLAQVLQLPFKKVLDSIAILEKLKIIERKENKIKILIDDIHLSPKNIIYRSWRNELKLYSLQQLNKLNQDNSYSFSVVFAANEKTKKIIQNSFLSFLKEIEPIVKKAPSEEAYLMSFDFLSWTKQ